MSQPLRVLAVFGGRNPVGEQIRTYLFGKGYHVLLITGGQPAMLNFQDRALFDVIIIDYRLFLEKGVRLIDALLEREAGQKFILVVPDKSNALRLVHSKGYSVTQVIPLPLDMEHLRVRIQTLCS